MDKLIKDDRFTNVMNATVKSLKVEFNILTGHHH